MEANGLNIIKLDTNSQYFILKKADELTPILKEKFSKKSYVIAYLDYEVLIGTLENNAFNFFNSKQIEYKYIQKMRVFNAYQELYIWRTRDGFKSRLRVDERIGEGKQEAVIAKQALFGTIARKLDSDFTKITEERGTTIILPFSDLSVNEEMKRIFIKTHNYIGYNNVNQATYTDCRFVCFCDETNDLT